MSGSRPLMQLRMDSESSPASHHTNSKNNNNNSEEEEDDDVGFFTLKEQDVEDEFHQRLAATNHRRSMGSNSNNNSSNNNHHNGQSSSSIHGHPLSSSSLGGISSNHNSSSHKLNHSSHGKSPIASSTSSVSVSFSSLPPQLSNSFWRASSNESAEPNFSSVSIRPKKERDEALTDPQQPSVLNGRHGSSVSLDSTGSNKDVRKRREKDRAAERNRKHDSLTSDIDIGHIVDVGGDAVSNSYLDMGSAELDRDTLDSLEFISHRPLYVDSNPFSTVPTPGKFRDMHPRQSSSLDRSSSDQSTGSLLYCKTPTTSAATVVGGPMSIQSSMHSTTFAGSGSGIVNGSSGGTLATSSSAATGFGSSPAMSTTGAVPVGPPPTGNGGSGSNGSSGSSGTNNSGVILGNSALGKSSSLIFPTGVDAPLVDDRGRGESDTSKSVRGKVNIRLDQCEAVRFRFKKKLMLDDLHLTSNDIPMKDLCGTPLGNTLYKLSLAKNRLGSIPPKLVMSLPALRSLDLSQCELHQLPEQFHLPRLARLNLRHNRFTYFPDEGILEGLPELQELDMYGNKVSEIVIPTNPKLLAKLETLDLGYNDIIHLPDELDQLKSLRTLKLMNNILSVVPMRVCDMDLKILDVASNPVTTPPLDTCERGICSMKRYWAQIRLEEQNKKKQAMAVQSRLQQRSKTSYTNRLLSGVMGKKSTKAPLSSPSLRPQLRKGLSTGNSETLLHPSENLSVSTSSHPSQGVKEASSSENSGTLKQFSMSDSNISSSSTSDVLRNSARAKLESSSSSDVFDSKHESAQVLDSTMLVDAFASAETVGDAAAANDLYMPEDQVAVNDTLKVIFVGMAMVGKTSMIKRLIEGKDATVPTVDERTVGVDIYDWEPKNDERFEHIDSRIEIPDKELRSACGAVDIKFSVWDFAGQHVYHATHELFFSNRALYVLVWDMGATNPSTFRKKFMSRSSETGTFGLDDSSNEGDSDDEVDLVAEEEERRADKALDNDIDEKVQFWIDCIQSTSPGAAILPVASFNDEFLKLPNGEAEAKRRCLMLKQRLVKHEGRRIDGIKDRLQEFHDQNRADDIAAVRLRKLLCYFTRPKIIFGPDDDSVVRVSGTEYTGFDRLTEKIINIATGKDQGPWKYPIFHGHVGARIPRMQLEVRDAVRSMRGKFKVVEWGYFVNELRDRGLTCAEDISDALHFLTNVGELSYFGNVMPGSQQIANPLKSSSSSCDLQKELQAGEKPTESADLDDDADVDEDEGTMLSIDNTSITAPSTTDGSASLDEFTSTGLSQFVFLNPRWLVAAVACILRHDLDREIKETRRLAASGEKRLLSRTASFYDAHLNCPIITADDACMLWQFKRITKKAAERAQEYSNDSAMTPFEFLQLLLIRFGVFVPIDLSIDKALFGGKEYQQLMKDMNGGGLINEFPSTIELHDAASAKAQFFFLPSLLGPCEPTDAWSYKSTDSWKTTLCHSILFPDGVPPGLMERLTASTLSSIYAASNRTTFESSGGDVDPEIATYEGNLVVKEILCWRSAFYIKVGSKSEQATVDSVVEIFTHLTNKESNVCVGSDYMGVGMHRLITSGRGQIGDGGRKIWKGGYLLVVKSIQRVMAEYSGLEFERHAFCPDCLAKKALSEASSWEMTAIRTAVMNADDMLHCQHGHRVDTRLVAGPSDKNQKQRSKSMGVGGEAGSVPVQDLLGAVVVVGLWDGKSNKIIRVGSGFIADKKRGLIVTAAHTLMNIWGDKKYPFGDNYYGLSRGKVVIGIIPRDGDGKDVAVFRYFAQIVSKDPSLDNGECRLDACVLRITTRMENDVGGVGEGCGDEPEVILLNDPKAMKAQQLQTLKITDKCELEEPVRIVGYNQGGEGLLGPGEYLNRYVDFAKGYVCMKFVHEDDPFGKRKERFKPREEIVVICPTIGGHSGGPCVNQQGEVIGILSRADPAESQRCYLVPASELKVLVSRAKKLI